MNREAEICADMNAAEGAAQASLAGSGAAVIQGNAPSALDELSRLDADVLILVDLVADASRRVELIERPALFAKKLQPRRSPRRTNFLKMPTGRWTARITVRPARFPSCRRKRRTAKSAKPTA